MTPGPPAGGDPQAEAGPNLERRSFHAQLLLRKESTPPDPRKVRPLPPPSPSRDVERGPTSDAGLAMRAAFTPIQRFEDRKSRRKAEAGPRPGRRSFHSRLLARPEPGPTEPRQARPSGWGLDRRGWIVRLLGQGAIFAGGLAIGGAVILVRRGEAPGARPALLIGFGVACILFAILAQVLARESARRPTSAAGG